MASDFHDDDPKTTWRNQPTEASRVSLVLIRQKARELHAKTRRQLLGTLTAPLFVAFFYGVSINQFADLNNGLHSLFVIALAWSFAGLYFLHQAKWPGTMPGEAGFTTGLESCRRAIEQRLHYIRRGLLWSFGPMLLAMSTFILALVIVAGTDIFPKGMPFITLVVFWIGAYFLIRVNQQRELQREIDELSAIEGENGGNSNST